MTRSFVGVIATNRELEGKFQVQAAGEHYLTAIAELTGAHPLIIPGLPHTQDVPAVLDIVGGVVLTGGRPNVHPTHFGAEPTPAYEPYDQNRDRVALDLVRGCVERGTPLFGICRGLQEINVAFGGSLHPEIRDIPGRMNHRMPRDEPDLDVVYGLRHDVQLIPDGQFARILETNVIRVNSLHGQGILEPGERIVIEGVADDGTPEAISVDGAPGFALGVQWHAEYKASENAVNRRLFEAFGEAMRAGA